MDRNQTSPLALHGLRVEIPRTLQAKPPLAADIDGRGNVRGIGGLGSYVPGGIQPTDGGAPPPGPEPSPSPQPNPGSSPGTGQPRTINFHITEDTSGGNAATELRVYGPIQNPFYIRQLSIIPNGTVGEGQFIAVFIAADNDPTDVASPTGTNIFPALSGQAALTSPDGDVGLPLFASPYRFDNVYYCAQAQQSIKVLAYFKAPALALPTCHVIITIEEILPQATNPVPTFQPPAPVPPGPTPQSPLLQGVIWSVIQDPRTRLTGPWKYIRFLDGRYEPYQAPEGITGYSYLDAVAFSDAVTNGTATQTETRP